MSNLGRPVNYAAREAKIEAILDGAVQCFVKKAFMALAWRRFLVLQSQPCKSLSILRLKNELILEIAKRYSSRISML